MAHPVCAVGAGRVRGYDGAPGTKTERMDEVINLQRLFQLQEENPQAIDALCAEQGLDPVVSHGVVLLMIANDGNLASLSPRQREHYERTIAPLLG